MTLSLPLRVAVTGMGGFAANHHQALLSLESRGLCRVVGACDPFPDNFTAQQTAWGFRERGVPVFDDWQKMLDALDGQLDVLTVPAPVPLHAPMHKAAVERGIACYLEKPPTLFWRELDEMIAVEKTAQFPTSVGFNFIIEMARQKLKQRLLNGEFGALRQVNFLGHWPRETSYFERAAWAGKISIDGRLVLDSCLGNATAHFVHNLLFWAGTREMLDWAKVEEIGALLSRAHDIENYDTAIAFGKFENGVEFRIAATHASKPPQYHREEVLCDQAKITYVTEGEWKIEWRDGRFEKGTADSGDLLTRNLAWYFDCLRGINPRPLTTLPDCIPFVHLTNLLYIAAGSIETAENINRYARWVAIQEIAHIMEAWLSAPLPEELKLTPATDIVKLEDVLSRLNSHD